MKKKILAITLVSSLLLATTAVVFATPQTTATGDAGIEFWVDNRTGGIIDPPDPIDPTDPWYDHGLASTRALEFGWHPTTTPTNPLRSIDARLAPAAAALPNVVPGDIETYGPARSWQDTRAGLAIESPITGFNVHVNIDSFMNGANPVLSGFGLALIQDGTPVGPSTTFNTVNINAATTGTGPIIAANPNTIQATGSNFVGELNIGGVDIADLQTSSAVITWTFVPIVTP